MYLIRLGRIASHDRKGQSHAGPLIIKLQICAQAGIEPLFRMGIHIACLPVGNLRYLLHQGHIALQHGHLFLIGFLPYVPLGKPQAAIPVHLKPLYHRIAQNLRVRLCQTGQPIQCFLYMVQVSRGTVIPAFAIPDPKKCAGFPGCFVLTQIAVLHGDRRLINVLYADIRVEILRELIHVNRLQSVGNLIIAACP